MSVTISSTSEERLLGPSDIFKDPLYLVLYYIVGTYNAKKMKERGCVYARPTSTRRTLSSRPHFFVR